jgi:acyl carrier protein
MQDIETRVLAIVGRYATSETAPGPGDRLADLRIDSLGMMELLFDLEEEFGVKIELNANDPEQLARWQDVGADVGAAVRNIELLVGQKGGAGRA